MKTTLKKITASVMAVATLAVSAAGMSASATEGTGTVGKGHSSLSVVSTSVNATTTGSSGTYLYVQIYEVGGNVDSGNYSNYTYTGSSTKAKLTGSNFSYAKSKHIVGATTGYLSVNK